MVTEIELNGARYAIGKLSAMQQFHVSRRIAPIIPSVIPVLMTFYAELERTDAAHAQVQASTMRAAIAGDARVAEPDAAPASNPTRGARTLVDVVAPVLQPLADALAGLKDEDADYVFDRCLSVVERRQDQGWARIWSPTQKAVMFDDIGIDVMLPLVMRVVMANLGSFIKGLLTSQASGTAET